MKIDISKIACGDLDGRVVWICDFRQPNFEVKPIRNVKPTKVVICSNSTSTKTFYYSKSHFAKLNIDGSISKKLYSLYDNTGYRSRAGIPLNVYDCEVECVEFWNNQLKTHSDKLVEYVKNVALKVGDISKSLIDNKIELGE